jgi:hypothetical protein
MFVVFMNQVISNNLISNNLIVEIATISQPFTHIKLCTILIVKFFPIEFILYF